MIPWLLPSAGRLVDALRDFGYFDWQFSALVCKTLWNYSDKMTSSQSCFGAVKTELLIEQLEVYLGEELHMCHSLCMSVCVCCVCVCVCVCVCMCSRQNPSHTSSWCLGETVEHPLANMTGRNHSIFILTWDSYQKF